MDDCHNVDQFKSTDRAGNRYSVCVAGEAQLFNNLFRTGDIYYVHIFGMRSADQSLQHGYYTNRCNIELGGCEWSHELHVAVPQVNNQHVDHCHIQYDLANSQCFDRGHFVCMAGEGQLFTIQCTGNIYDQFVSSVGMWSAWQPQHHQYHYKCRNTLMESGNQCRELYDPV